MKARFFRTLSKMGRFSVAQGLGLLKLSPMIEKIVLGESLNFLIGKLKLSYKRIFPIIGESLAEVRSGLRRGGLFGIFIAEYAMKAPFFLNNFIFVLMHFCVFLKDQPYGVVIFTAC